jgi:glycosyltransferase involved in cell wall biosynthesis
MNIAHMLPYSVQYPLKVHNGRYDWVRQLAELQSQQGHTVTIYSHPDSFIEGIQCVGVETIESTREQTNVQAFRLAFENNHDVYHSHFDNLHYIVGTETTRPIVYTQHWWPSEKTIELARSYPSNNIWAVPPTIYMFQQDMGFGIQSKGHIYHGVDLNTFKPIAAKKSGRLLFVGRISEEKNLEIAIRTAVEANVGLDIVGKITSKNELYWQSLQPMIDGELITYIGSKSQTELVQLYSAALAVICPYEPTEAFGLVAIEAQACGTPVIMKAGGSRAELIEENKTGFLCDSESDYIHAMAMVASLHSEDCTAFAQKFDISSMVEAYEQLYKNVV